MSARYIAVRDIRIGRGEIRKAGQPVPEANNWRNPKTWMNAGHIRLATAGDPVDVSSAPEPDPVLPDPEPDVQAEAVQVVVKNKPVVKVKKKAGRPKGSKSKPKAKRGPGRPRGSSNK